MALDIFGQLDSEGGEKYLGDYIITGGKKDLQEISKMLTEAYALNRRIKSVLAVSEKFAGAGEGSMVRMTAKECRVMMTAFEGIVAGKSKASKAYKINTLFEQALSVYPHRGST